MKHIDEKVVNFKFLNQEPLDFDELKTLMNSNRVYETLKPVEYLFNVRNDGVIKIHNGDFPSDTTFVGKVENEAPKYRINVGSYILNDRLLFIENILEYFTVEIYQESVHGLKDDVTIIRHLDSGRYLRCCYNYQSYQGYVYDECCWVEVKPKEVTRVEYVV